MKKIMYLDVCGTLFDSNTTFDFLDFYLTGFNKYMVRFLRKFFFFKVLNKISLSIFNFDFVRCLAVYFLKGVPKSELNFEARRFIAGLNEIQEVFNYIDKNYRDIEQVFLLSASLDFIVEEVCLYYDFSGSFSSSLTYDDNMICKGTISNDLLFSKSTILEKHLINCYKIFITDNYSDASSAEYVDEFYPVLRVGDKKAMSFWKAKGFLDTIEY